MLYTNFSYNWKKKCRKLEILAVLYFKIKNIQLEHLSLLHIQNIDFLYVVRIYSLHYFFFIFETKFRFIRIMPCKHKNANYTTNNCLKKNYFYFWMSTTQMQLNKTLYRTKWNRIAKMLEINIKIGVIQGNICFAKGIKKIYN